MTKLFNVTADKMPNILRLELANTCNLTCPHCRYFSPEKKLPENLSEYYKTMFAMSEDQVRKIFEEIGPYKPSCTLNIGNEPLHAPQFKFCVTELKKYGCTGTINTNGLLLNKDMCNFLVEQQFDSVSISIDASTKESLKKTRGITSIDKLIRNVKRLVEIRGDNSLPRIMVSFVIMPYNANEVPEFLNFWKNIVDVIRFTGCVPDPNIINKDEKPDLSMVPGIEMEKMPARTPCLQIYRDMLIKANGDVSPCCINDVIVMGNIFKDGGIEKVWNGKKFQEWRNLHNQSKWDDISCNGNSPCKGCDFWVESLQPKEKETEEFIIRSPSPHTVFYNVKKRFDNWDQVNLVERQGFGNRSLDRME